MVASVDIGANSVRLLVGKILPGGHLERISQERAIVRLGRGVKGTGFLQKEPVELALDLLGRYVTIAAEKGVEKILACATSAVREAKNAPCFLRAVKDETGLEVKVLSGWEEASWSMEGMKGVWEAPHLSGWALMWEVEALRYSWPREMCSWMPGASPWEWWA
jgi:exopolyphosphatase/guanosine-5'-triphosphate,3'-diphosphate pyrophosphatase